MDLIVIILTFNEEIHIERSIKSVKGLARQVLVVDSGSTDKTTLIAKNCGARVVYNKFVNHGHQFNWALKQIKNFDGYILRLDADEVLSETLKSEIAGLLSKKKNYAAYEINRRISFLGATLKSGVFKENYIVRLFRFGFGKSEERWMDEHIRVDGSVGRLSGEIIDQNEKGLTDWFSKHNVYASREAVEYFLFERSEKRHTQMNGLSKSSEMRRRRKYLYYYSLPPFCRCFMLFVYNYFVLFGFMDGLKGFIFNFLQSFLYRCLVDSKIIEIKYRIRSGKLKYDTKSLSGFMGIKE
ncbi:glycosyltransferase family 2 protein [Alphaproteobacteria bacterium]|nr:glycosyltransferase family 2 protein [Alphaproteobacteria bacterium]MDC0444479.1 glycosyltransferase family 2 protein [Alphaproteobacteria bacterium]